MRTKQEYLLSLPFEYILGFSRETGLIRRKGYFTKKDFVYRLLRNLQTSECSQLYEFYKAGDSYKKSVDWFLCNYPTSGMIEKSFVNYLTSKNKNLGTFFFEFPILKTRVDILRLEEKFHAYEVKSQRDKIDRIHYQLPALKEYFEYTNLIIPSKLEQRLKEIVGREVGIIIFTLNHDEITFEIDREPEIIDDFNEYAQLELLRMCELRDICNQIGGVTSKEKPRGESIKTIIENFSRYEINEFFKSKIRNREKTLTRMSLLAVA